MKRFLLALLFLSLPAVAQAVRPAPAQPVPLIQQQPPTYPGQAHVPAGAGASHGSLATPSRPAVERSPNTRVLPVSNEPGVWAADGDPALASGNLTPPTMLDVGLPVTPSMLNPLGVAFVQQCGTDMNRVLRDIAEYARAKALPLDVRRCLVAKLFQVCAKTHADAAAALISHGRQDLEEDFRKYDLMEKTAAIFLPMSCADVAPSAAADTIFKKAVHRWMSKGPSTP